MEGTSYCTAGELRCLVEKGAWPQREMLLVLAQTAGEFEVLTEFDELISGFRAALQIDRLQAVDRAIHFLRDRKKSASACDAEALSRLRILAQDCYRVLTAEALEEAEASEKSEHT